MRRVPGRPAPTASPPCPGRPAPSGAAQYVHTLQSLRSLQAVQQAPGPSTKFLSPASTTVPAVAGSGGRRCREDTARQPSPLHEPTPPSLTIQIEGTLGIALPAGGGGGCGSSGVVDRWRRRHGCGAGSAPTGCSARSAPRRLPLLWRPAQPRGRAAAERAGRSGATWPSRAPWSKLLTTEAAA